MSRKQLWLGLAVMILVKILLGILTVSVASESAAGATTHSVLTSFLAAFAGGMVARHGFVLPALGVWLALWAYVGCVAYQIGGPAVQTPLPSIIQPNLAAFLLSGIATGLAACLGQRLTGTGKGRVAAT